MQLCPECKRKKRVVTVLIKRRGRKFWVNKCVTCGTAMHMEEIDGPETR